ncbi:MAG: aminopeptidase P N-terminal domain-containing protein [Ignavibacteriae bacterium]|nr:aminopeptidase P N-terminal domain-containing protein [Ignavibacteriota bacterium]
MSKLRTFSFTALVLLLFVVGSVAQDVKYVEYDTDLIAPSVHKARREKVMAEIGNDALAVFYSAPVRNRNNDVDFQYRQDDNFYYLTGFTEPNAILLLVPKGVSVKSMEDTSKMVTVKEVLFVQPKNPLRETWEGRRYGPTGAVKLRGLEYAMNNTEFKSMIGTFFGFMSQPRELYIPTFREDLTGEIAELLEPLKPVVYRMSSRDALRDPTAIVRKMRIVKSPEEIELLKKATEISAWAHNEAMMSVEPGMKEYEVDAVYQYIFKKNGAEYPGYPCIVGASENSVILHYNTNRRPLKDGDVILADCAAEYHGYSSDVTRTYPVNGTFTKEQREIYQIVLDAQNAAIATIKPGSKWSDASAAADQAITDGLYKLGLIKEKTRAEMRRFYMHGLGHPVGLNVHDVGQPVMEEGMLYTVEPGIYISEDSGAPARYRNIGVRIEDVILVTPTGNVNLSAGSPREINEIESLMKKKGVGSQSMP